MKRIIKNKRSWILNITNFKNRLLCQAVNRYAATLMKTLQILTIIVLTSLTFQSCSYTWTRLEATDGKKSWVHQYKDYEKQEQFEDNYIFNNWKIEQAYQKYTGRITTDTTHGSTFIQFDSIRVYLFSGANKYKSVFTSGLITGQMLYCKMDSTCKPTQGLKMTDVKTGEPIIENLWGWTGHTITIDYFEELKNVKSKPTQRKFKFWVYPYKKRFNGGNAIFLLELTNEKATKQTDIDEFIKGATVTFITHARSMI